MSSELAYSAQSVKASRLRPGRMVRSSEEAGWRSMLVQVFEQPTTVDEYETVASPDALLVFVLEGRYRLESLSSGSWKGAEYRPGVGGFTAPFTTNRLRWTAKGESAARVVRLYVPQRYLEEAHGARSGMARRVRAVLPDALSLTDPVLFSVAKAALGALEEGECDLYADACARFLAIHLVCRLEKLSFAAVQDAGAPELTDRRLRRVLELVRHEFTKALSVERLAQEAAMSPFHFARTFKAKVGTTPYQHIRRLRLRQARGLLAETDLSVLQVAEACGWVHDGHFAAAFRKAFGCTPSEYRKRLVE